MRRNSHVCPPPGCRPICKNRVSNLARRAARRTSQPSARFMPAPTAAPLTAASVGNGLRAMRRKPSYTPDRLSPVASARLPRLAPAQNAGGAPVTTTAPMRSSASISSIAATMSATIGAVSVLRSPGLFSVSVATPSDLDTSTSDMGVTVASGAHARPCVHRRHRRAARGVRGGVPGAPGVRRALPGGRAARRSVVGDQLRAARRGPAATRRGPRRLRLAVVEPEHAEFAIEVTYEGLYELAEETLADGASTLLDQHFGALGGWIAATLVRLGDLHLEFRPAE